MPVWVKRITQGALRTNAYLVSDGISPDVMLIDAPEEPDALVAAIEQSGLRLVRVVATHSHWDHIAGVLTVVERFDVPFWLGAQALESLGEEPDRVLALRGLRIDPPPQPACLLVAGDVVPVGSLRFVVRDTPGHWRGDISLYEPAQGAVFVGDAVFRGGVGRHNPGCDLDVLRASIATQLLTLPGETTVYPGHGLSTTVARERAAGTWVWAG